MNRRYDRHGVEFARVLAFISRSLAVAIWLLTVPFGIIAERMAPSVTDRRQRGYGS